MYFCYCDGVKVIYMYKLVYECLHIHVSELSFIIEERSVFNIIWELVAIVINLCFVE